jgi:hypothetical protein
MLRSRHDADRTSLYRRRGAGKALWQGRQSLLVELVVEQAQRALEAAVGVKQIAQHGKNQLVGPLRIGAFYTVGPYLFPELIPILRKLVRGRTTIRP